jgi:hypothetical protein
MDGNWLHVQRWNLGHDYIRDSAPNKITEQRKKLRMQTDALTNKRLIEKYGQDWRKIIWPKTQAQWNLIEQV